MFCLLLQQESLCLPCGFEARAKRLGNRVFTWFPSGRSHLPGSCEIANIRNTSAWGLFDCASRVSVVMQGSFDCLEHSTTVPYSTLMGLLEEVLRSLDDHSLRVSHIFPQEACQSGSLWHSVCWQLTIHMFSSLRP